MEKLLKQSRIFSQKKTLYFIWISQIVSWSQKKFLFYLRRCLITIKTFSKIWISPRIESICLQCSPYPHISLLPKYVIWKPLVIYSHFRLMLKLWYYYCCYLIFIVTLTSLFLSYLSSPFFRLIRQWCGVRWGWLSSHSAGKISTCFLFCFFCCQRLDLWSHFIFRIKCLYFHSFSFLYILSRPVIRY